MSMAFKAIRLSEMSFECGRRKRNIPIFRGQRYPVKQPTGLKRSNQRDKQKTRE